MTRVVNLFTMDIGSEFATWDCFTEALEKFSRDNEVTYHMGLCNPVETASRQDEQLDPKLKYSYARMLCSHGGSLKGGNKKGKSSKKKDPISMCMSSILVHVNKQRNALVIVEANLKHEHETPPKWQADGNERRMVHLLLRCGIPFKSVMTYTKHLHERKIDLIWDFDSTSDKRLLMKDERRILYYLDRLTASDPECVTEFLDFDRLPDVLYLQTCDMKERVKGMDSNLMSCVQLVTFKHKAGKCRLFGIIAAKESMESHDILALCITSRQHTSLVRHFVVAFFKHNKKFCNNVQGLVVNCDKDDSDFISLFFPHAHIAWSKQFILERFENGVKDLNVDVQHCLSAFQEIVNSSTETEYNDRLKIFLDAQSSDFSTYFLTHWDSHKKMWLQYEISCVVSLQHQMSQLEKSFTTKMSQIIEPNFGFSEIYIVLISSDRNHKDGDSYATSVVHLRMELWNSFYRWICLPQAADIVTRQAAIGYGGSYNIHKSGASGKVTVETLNTEERFILDVEGTKCNCQLYKKTKLPCEHIFAWRETYGLEMRDESLIPFKWQEFPKLVTLISVAQDVSKGTSPSSAHLKERLGTLEKVLKAIQECCSSQSFKDKGRDIARLKNVMNLNTKLENEVKKDGRSKNKNKGSGESNENDKVNLKSNSCYSFYHSICASKVADAVVGQVAIGESGWYNIHRSGLLGKVFVERVDLEEECVLDVAGTKCTCEYFRDSELPCEHIFAWRSLYDLEMCDKSLIPSKWHLLSSQDGGAVSSPDHSKDRAKALQVVLRDISNFCTSRTYEDLGRDIIQLKQILNSVKRRKVEVGNEKFHRQKDDKVDEDKTSSTVLEKNGKCNSSDQEKEKHALTVNNANASNEQRNCISTQDLMDVTGQTEDGKETAVASLNKNVGESGKEGIISSPRKRCATQQDVVSSSGSPEKVVPSAEQEKHLFTPSPTKRVRVRMRKGGQRDETKSFEPHNERVMKNDHENGASILSPLRRGRSGEQEKDTSSESPTERGLGSGLRNVRSVKIGEIEQKQEMVCHDESVETSGVTVERRRSLRSQNKR